MIPSWIVWLICCGGIVVINTLWIIAIRINRHEDRVSEGIKPTGTSKSGSTVGDKNKGRGGHDKFE